MKQENAICDGVFATWHKGGSPSAAEWLISWTLLEKHYRQDAAKVAPVESFAHLADGWHLLNQIKDVSQIFFCQTQTWLLSESGLELMKSCSNRLNVKWYSCAWSGR